MVKNIEPTQSESSQMDIVKNAIRTIPDHPEPGILFRDITTLLSNPDAFAGTIEAWASQYDDKAIDHIVGIEARGFVFGAVLAYRLKTSFVPIRKKGKLPSSTITEDYDLEYGSDTIEIHDDAVAPGARVVLIDDLIATGGTAIAALTLLEKVKAEVVACCFVVDLPDLGGSDKLKKRGCAVHTLVEFEGA